MVFNVDWAVAVEVNVSNQTWPPNGLLTRSPPAEIVPVVGSLKTANNFFTERELYPVNFASVETSFVVELVFKVVELLEKLFES